ncbi:MAG: DnaJ domain-containing protein [Waterburya sp.]
MPKTKNQATKPKGGRGRRANYETKTVRIPLPLLKEVETLLERFYQENASYEKLPTAGSWWQVLGVSHNAQPTEVKQAYRRLSVLYHPDTNLRRDAHQRIVALNRAYSEYQQINH